MIHASEISRTAMYVPDNISQKPYESWACITDTSSKQWKLLHGKEVKLNDDGTISVDGYVCTAMGSRYGKVGDRFLVRLSSGRWLKIIKADAKQDRHTVDGYTGRNGHILEMIVWSVPTDVEQSGSYDTLKAYQGTITKIYKEKK
ncbi:MAG: hypothetical protein GX671_05900 [Clostridiales bacterium]|nr:hypothetical protein [Clostridiales bacterium]